MPLVNGTMSSSVHDQGRLELEDGFACQGTNYGAQTNISGELVFQTGMVGYPESLTDPSYSGQILVCTFPLAGNYGVPSRDTPDPILDELPAHFESRKIHIAGLITASYSGQNYSHYLAHSSLGQWLKENNVPAIYGVDTRALTKRIREKGSMLGRMLLDAPESQSRANASSRLPFVDPNRRNLVAQGEPSLKSALSYINLINFLQSLYRTIPNIFAFAQVSAQASTWSFSQSLVC